MKVFLSVFKNEKCSSCNKAFQITSKRRQCKQCKKLFCKDCSIKIRDPKFIIRHKRYCLQCYSIIERSNKSKSFVTPIGSQPVPDSVKPQARDTNFIPSKNDPIPESIVKKSDPTPVSNIPEANNEESKIRYEKRASLIKGAAKKLSVFVLNPAMDVQSHILRENPLNAYEIEEQLYSNENFTVFTVKSLSNNQTYSMKKILPKDNEERANIFEEANMHLTNFHSNLIKYHAVYSFENYFWIILEKHEGILFDLLSSRAGFIPEKHMSYVCKEILKGLDYLHTTGRIHRDIKSRNVVIFHNGKVKLGDFGYAAQVGEEYNMAKQNPSWMAPELILGKDYNESVDLWSLGILLLEMAEGSPPYEGENYDTVMQNIITNPAPKLRNKLKWSKDMTNFLSLCLRKEPIERLSAKSLLMHPFIEENDEQTSTEQFAEYYLQYR